MWRTEHNFWESVLSIHHMGSGASTQVYRCGHVYPGLATNTFVPLAIPPGPVFQLLLSREGLGKNSVPEEAVVIVSPSGSSLYGDWSLLGFICFHHRELECLRSLPRWQLCQDHCCNILETPTFQQSTPMHQPAHFRSGMWSGGQCSNGSRDLEVTWSHSASPGKASPTWLPLLS